MMLLHFYFRLGQVKESKAPALLPIEGNKQEAAVELE
jgi:hypothetical protein